MCIRDRNVSVAGGCGDQSQYGVGISLLQNKLVDIGTTNNVTASDAGCQFAAADVLIFSPAMLRELKTIRKQLVDVCGRLWNSKIRCFICDSQNTVDEAEELAQDIGASFIVILHDAEGFMRVRCLKEKDPSGHTFLEDKVSPLDLSEFLQKKFEKYDKELSSGATFPKVDNLKPIDHHGIGVGGNPTAYAQTQINFNYSVLEVDKRQVSNLRKRLELNVRSKISSKISD